MRRSLVPLLLFIYFFAITAQGQVIVPPQHPIPSDGSGSLRAPDIENFIRQVESWNANYHDRFEYLKSLLYKEPFNTQNYSNPAVWVYLPQSNNINESTSNNISVARNQRFEIGALILNQNPIEIRRTLYLKLEIQEPGEENFKPAKTANQIIQVNDYNEKTNATAITFPEFTSFGFLKRVGDVKFRINVSDGRLYHYYSSSLADFPKESCYGELKMNVYNVPPQINNNTMRVTPNATWDGFIEYRASLNSTGQGLITPDSEKSTINATLHIYNENKSLEKFNISKAFPEGDEIIFNTKDASFFTEKDAGKNFSYRFSVCDSVIGGDNTTWSNIEIGPHLKKNPKIVVIVPQPNGKDAEDANNYWWHRYSFNVMVKSLDPDVKNVQVTLLTDTPDHPGRVVPSTNNPQSLAVTTENYTNFEFNGVKPFDVLDCGKTFNYYFTYDVVDKNGSKQTYPVVGGIINPRVLYYPLVSITWIGNLLAILLVSLFIGVLLERTKFWRGGI